MSRVVRFYEAGPPEVLRLIDVDVPPPGKGQVRIRVKAIGLNRAEAMFRAGQYLEEPKFPASLGYEAAGEIELIGEGVEGFAVGDAVSVVPAFSMNEYGLYGELVLAPAYAVVKNPPNLSFVEAAASWMMYLTAYGALIGIAKLAAGDFVLIPAASSSVGIAAIQIANIVGATPIALTRSGAKRARLLELGAAHVIATEEQDLVAEALRITGGHGARVVFDPVGGPTLAKLASATAQLGIIFQYGALSPEPTTLPLFELLARLLTIRGYVLFEVTSRSGAVGSGQALRRGRPRQGRAEAGHREDVPARRHRRGASLSGIEPADRQNRRHGVSARPQKRGRSLRRAAHRLLHLGVELAPDRGDLLDRRIARTGWRVCHIRKLRRPRPFHTARAAAAHKAPRAIHVRSCAMRSADCRFHIAAPWPVGR